MVLIYGVSIVNTVESFIANQLGGPDIPRAILSPALVGLMTLALAFGHKIMFAVAQLIVYPLILALAAVSVYSFPNGTSRPSWRPERTAQVDSLSPSS